MRRKSGELVKVDDPQLDPIWAECGRLGIPVAIHTTDPEAFFHPLNGENERYEELIHNPDWSFYGPQFPSKESVLTARQPLDVSTSDVDKVELALRPAVEVSGRIQLEGQGKATSRMQRA